VGLRIHWHAGSSNELNSDGVSAVVDALTALTALQSLNVRYADSLWREGAQLVGHIGEIGAVRESDRAAYALTDHFRRHCPSAPTLLAWMAYLRSRHSRR
jgi:hypothetical protein